MRILLTSIVVLPLPLLILAYHAFRLGFRRGLLQAKIQELRLEREYLRVFHYVEWGKLRTRTGEALTQEFQRVFVKQFQGDNSFRNYLLPLVLAIATTALFGFVVWSSLDVPRSVADYVKTQALPFAIAGALVYSFPAFVSRFASLSLNPHTVFELLAKLWLSVLIGVLLASVIVDQVQALVAFVGGLTPGPALELLQKKVYGDKPEAKGTATNQLLDILKGDETLLSQLNYIGIRSVLELAYENPLRIFVETDLNLVVCIDVVDQANYYLYVPEADTRRELNRYGVRTAIDLMTQVYLAEDPADPDSEFDFVDPEQKLAAALEESLRQIAGAMKLELAAFRNLLQMMIDNPQLRYVHNLWNTLRDDVDLREEDAVAQGGAGRAAPIPAPAVPRAPLKPSAPPNLDADEVRARPPSEDPVRSDVSAEPDVR